MVEKFYNSTVLAAISNTDYEGEIKAFGDKVHIRTKPTIAIKEYTADGLLVAERPSGGEVILNIDKGRYWNTILDDVMRTQSDINLLSIWAEDAAEQMKISIDTDVLQQILVQAATANKGATAGASSASINLGITGTPLVLAPTAGSGIVDILDAILRLGQVLDEQNIPETGRWLVLPAWAATLIKRSELRQAYLSGDAVSMLRNGRIGMVDRFTIYSSNLLPKGVLAAPPAPTGGALAAGETVMYAGHPHALTFASQMTEMEVMRSEHTFGNLQRGLQVYGYKVIAPVALAQAVIKPAP
jgi:hypothetical protein